MGHSVEPVSVRCSVCELALDDDYYLQEWLTCQTCFINVHIRCYCDGTPSSKHWRCERCAADSTDPCAVCGDFLGAMKLVDQDNAPTMPEERTDQPQKGSRLSKEQRLLFESAASVGGASYWKHIKCIGKAPGANVRSFRPNRGVPPKQLQKSEEYLTTCEVKANTRNNRKKTKKPVPELSDCPFCAKPLTDFENGYKGLEKHINQHYARGHEPIEDASSCPYCEKVFQKNFYMKQHLISCARKHVCPKCHKTSLDFTLGAQGLKQHISRHKEASTPNATKRKTPSLKLTAAAVAVDVPPHETILAQGGSTGVLCATNAPGEAASKAPVGADGPPSAPRVAEDLHGATRIQVITLIKAQYDSSLAQMQQLMAQAQTPLNRMILEREVAFINTLCKKLDIAEFDGDAIARSWK